jgi:thiol-disulfide isomerase/thioredoxin
MFANATNKIGTTLVNYKKFILVLFLASLFIITAIYVYKNYINKGRSSQGNNTISSSTSHENKSAELYLFSTEWCPHCKKTKPEWEQLKNNYADNNNINGYNLTFVEVDCDANPEVADKFKVEGYPTIKLVKGNQIIEFDAKPDVKTMENFLSTVLAN